MRSHRQLTEHLDVGRELKRTLVTLPAAVDDELMKPDLYIVRYTIGGSV